MLASSQLSATVVRSVVRSGTQFFCIEEYLPIRIVLLDSPELVHQKPQEFSPELAIEAKWHCTELYI